MASAAGLIVLALIPDYIPKHSLTESTSQIQNIRSELSAARQRWEAYGITNYSIEVSVYIHPHCWIDTETVTVRHGIIITNDERTERALNTCSIKAFLPPQVFETVERELQLVDPSDVFLQIEFDPKYGYISKYDLESNSRSSDLRSSLSFTNFHPLPDMP